MELFDIGRKKEKVRRPTAPQMRLLHVIAAGKLQFEKWPGRPYSIIDSNGQDFAWRFHEKVAHNVVLHGWAEMKSFADRSKAEYRISKSGREVLKELCEHTIHGYEYDQKVETLGGTLVCKQCGRALRCRSKQPTPHSANRWHFRYGPMCNSCWEFMFGSTTK